MTETKYNDDLPCQEYRMPDADIRGVRIRGVRIRGVRIRGVRIRGVRIRGVRIQRSVVVEKLGIAPEYVDIEAAMLGFTKSERCELGHEMTNRFFREIENEIAMKHPE